MPFGRRHNKDIIPKYKDKNFIMDLYHYYVDLWYFTSSVVNVDVTSMVCPYVRL